MRRLLGVLFTVLFLSPLAEAETLLCELADQPNSSELRLDYSDGKVTAVFLRSPGESVYRQLPVAINMVVTQEETRGQSEAILVKPIPPKDIDWEKVGQCFVEAGTTWYFEFSYVQDRYQVQFVPFYAVQFPRCVTPRVLLQTHRLSCKKQNL